MEVTAEVVFALIQSEEAFPIDFDVAWQWLGYNKKQQAKQKLVKNFEKGLDFEVFTQTSVNLSQQGLPLSGGRPKEVIKLTVECCKSLAMMAGTSKGKQVRRYFLQCEIELKRRIHQEQEQNKQRVISAFVDEQHLPWQKRFEDEFFDEAYRVTGWKAVVKGHPPCMGNFINNNVYEWFPEGVTERLAEVNPRVNGRLKRKKHQHLKQPGLVFFETQKTAVLAVMRLSPANNRKKFEQNMDKALGNAVQLELPLMDDL